MSSKHKEHSFIIGLFAAHSVGFPTHTASGPLALCMWYVNIPHPLPRLSINPLNSSILFQSSQQLISGVHHQDRLPLPSGCYKCCCWPQIVSADTYSTPSRNNYSCEDYRSSVNIDSAELVCCGFDWAWVWPPCIKSWASESVAAVLWLCLGY